MNAEQTKLINYVEDLTQIKKIQGEIQSIQDRLDLLDHELDDAGVYNDLLNKVDTEYWIMLKKEQIELELELNEVERKTLLFEKSVLYR